MIQLVADLRFGGRIVLASIRLMFNFFFMVHTIN
jgi:hypothetical protein